MELAWDAAYLFIIIWKDIWWRVMRLAGTAAYLKYYYLEGHLVESDGTSMGCCVFKIYSNYLEGHLVESDGTSMGCCVFKIYSNYLEGHLVKSDGTSMGCCVFKIYTVTIWKDIWWRVMELACAAPHPGGTTARSLSATTNSPGTRTTLCQEIAT